MGGGLEWSHREYLEEQREKQHEKRAKRKRKQTFKDGVSNKRVVIDSKAIEKALERFAQAVSYRLNQKGYGTFASTDEIDGVLEREMREWREAKQLCKYDEFKDNNSLQSELIDVAVTAFWGALCIKEKGVDW